MECDVDFNLNPIIRAEIIKYSDLIKSILENYRIEIYLFGSIDKGNYSKNSDIDLLVILNSIELSARDKKVLRCKIRDLAVDLEIDDNLSKELDCKVYGEIDFNRSSIHSNLEKQIARDLVRATTWR